MPDPRQWGEYNELRDASVQGMNHLQTLPKILKDAIPSLRDYDFCLSSESDVPVHRASFWKHLTVGDLGDVDSFNDQIGLQFGLTEKGGNIVYRENYVMIMPNKFRRDQVEARHRRYEEKYKKQTKGLTYVTKEDPKAEEYEKDKAVVYSEFSTETFLPDENVQAGTTRKGKKTVVKSD